jgi:endonuclease YncB( thermonuclease family)
MINGRTVGKVMLSDAKDINLEQVDRGMAWFYR